MPAKPKPDPFANISNELAERIYHIKAHLLEDIREELGEFGNLLKSDDDVILDPKTASSKVWQLYRWKFTKDYRLPRPASAIGNNLLGFDCPEQFAEFENAVKNKWFYPVMAVGAEYDEDNFIDDEEDELPVYALYGHCGHDTGVRAQVPLCTNKRDELKVLFSDKKTVLKLQKKLRRSKRKLEKVRMAMDKERKLWSKSNKALEKEKSRWKKKAKKLERKMDKRGEIKTEDGEEGLFGSVLWNENRAGASRKP